MEDRLVGDGDESLPAPKVFSELNSAESRPFQKSRGEELPSGVLNGED